MGVCHSLKNETRAPLAPPERTRASRSHCPRPDWRHQFQVYGVGDTRSVPSPSLNHGGCITEASNQGPALEIAGHDDEMVERANSRLWYSPARPHHLLPPKNSCCRSCSLPRMPEIREISARRRQIVEGPSPSHLNPQRQAGLRMIIERGESCLSLLQERPRLPENADMSLVAGRHVVGNEGSVAFAHL
ncbi:hypothetical protein SAMN05444171_5000 [Bradyrhizobium lablabi]|uniref:Uncharacterized protein n=2 Tax=Bradyrhizobium TaxID=374 RepID=A0ABY0PEB7_9BRAD|nr:hypothetical protein SAMN05444163_2169 [Bradyrhizobium ottawaense]SED74035.1 hypothetical protein SAMN05444171_5000 [Bradyrhizobium lablabi]SHL69728.1 hypothetical protein SAMN05444321_3791 [Bradyrhizobium lablabi]